LATSSESVARPIKRIVLLSAVAWEAAKAVAKAREVERARCARTVVRSGTWLVIAVRRHSVIAVVLLNIHGPIASIAIRLAKSAVKLVI
jgi:hypothetical protein